MLCTYITVSVELAPKFSTSQRMHLADVELTLNTTKLTYRWRLVSSLELVCAYNVSTNECNAFVKSELKNELLKKIVCDILLLLSTLYHDEGSKKIFVDLFKVLTPQSIKYEMEFGLSLS